MALNSSSGESAVLEITVDPGAMSRGLADVEKRAADSANTITKKYDFMGNAVQKTFDKTAAAAKAAAEKAAAAAEKGAAKQAAAAEKAAAAAIKAAERAAAQQVKAAERAADQRVKAAEKESRAVQKAYEEQTAAAEKAANSQKLAMGAAAAAFLAGAKIMLDMAANGDRFVDVMAHMTTNINEAEVALNGQVDTMTLALSANKATQAGLQLTGHEFRAVALRAKEFADAQGMDFQPAMEQLIQVLIRGTDRTKQFGIEAKGQANMIRELATEYGDLTAEIGGAGDSLDRTKTALSNFYDAAAAGMAAEGPLQGLLDFTTDIIVAFHQIAAASTQAADRTWADWERWGIVPGNLNYAAAPGTLRVDPVTGVVVNDQAQVVTNNSIEGVALPGEDRAAGQMRLGAPRPGDIPTPAGPDARLAPDPPRRGGGGGGRGGRGGKHANAEKDAIARANAARIKAEAEFADETLRIAKEMRDRNLELVKEQAEAEKEVRLAVLQQYLDVEAQARESAEQRLISEKRRTTSEFEAMEKAKVDAVQQTTTAMITQTVAAIAQGVAQGQSAEQIANGIAEAAAWQALAEAAAGVAMLAVTWGIPNPSSAGHFVAAGMYGALAVGAAGVGAIAGAGGGGGGGGRPHGRTVAGPAGGGGFASPRGGGGSDGGGQTNLTVNISAVDLGDRATQRRVAALVGRAAASGFGPRGARR